MKPSLPHFIACTKYDREKINVICIAGEQGYLTAKVWSEIIIISIFTILYDF